MTRPVWGAILFPMEDSSVFDKNTVEFVTVAAQYCSFLEQAHDYDGRHLLDVLSKLLPLLYLKAAMLPETRSQGLYLEENVTEGQYDALRSSLARVLGSDDDYLEVFVEDMKYSDTPVRCCISEGLADVYQALGNFVHSFRSGLHEVMEESVAVCREGFVSYWGQTLANTLRAVHNVAFAQNGPDDGDNYLRTDSLYD